MDPLDCRKLTLKWLDEHDIPYTLYEHERAHTIDDCLHMPFIDEHVTICKNIVLCNRQLSRFYLLLLKPLTPFRTSFVSKELGSSRLSFAPESILQEKLCVSSGSVSPFGLLFDQQHEITLCYETGVCDTPRIAFHPCDNTATVVFEQEVFWKQAVPALGAEVIGIDFSRNQMSD